MLFKKEFMIDLVYDELEEASIVEEKIIDKSQRVKIVFNFNGKFYESSYNMGATEMQDVSPYEHAKNEIECPEVHLVEKTVIWGQQKCKMYHHMNMQKMKLNVLKFI